MRGKNRGWVRECYAHAVESADAECVGEDRQQDALCAVGGFVEISDQVGVRGPGFDGSLNGGGSTTKKRTHPLKLRPLQHFSFTRRVRAFISDTWS